jgi:hypothetical protein
MRNVCKNGLKGARQRTLSLREFLASKQITLLEHSPYSQDLVPSDFSLFLKIKEILKGRHFHDTDDIKNNKMAAMMAIPQSQFQNCFEGWTGRWHRSIASQGEYFEGDHSDIQVWYVALLVRRVREIYCQITCIYIYDQFISNSL